MMSTSDLTCVERPRDRQDLGHEAGAGEQSGRRCLEPGHLRLLSDVKGSNADPW